MSDIEKNTGLAEEIRELEARLVRKKKELSHGETLSQEKEVFSDVLRDHLEELKNLEAKEAEESADTNTQTHVPAVQPHDYVAQAQAKADDLQEREHQEQVDALLEIAFTKGIASAVEVARHLKNPHLLDDFHDALVDDYYEKLLNARKISRP